MGKDHQKRQPTKNVKGFGVAGKRTKENPHDLKRTKEALREAHENKRLKRT